MPEYLAPGVYVEEVPNSVHPIEGVPMSTAAFVGAAHAGPGDTAVGPITSLVEFESQFGDGRPMDFEGLPPTPCFLFAAARAFFNEGGRRLWIARITRSGSEVDGARPQVDDFERGLSALDEVEEISIIAAPGATYGAGGAFADDARRISAQLIVHAETTGNRFAILDCPDGSNVTQALAWRSAFSTSFAALYFPWLYVSSSELTPPSGALAGIYARVDTNPWDLACTRQRNRSGSGRRGRHRSPAAGRSEHQRNQHHPRVHWRRSSGLGCPHARQRTWSGNT